jgi:hypothetical protein
MKPITGKDHVARRRVGDNRLAVDAVVLRQRRQMPYDLAS